MPKYHDEDFEHAFKQANEAFWRAVAECFPDIKTGDFPPHFQFQWEADAVRAITRWVACNAD